MRLSVALFAFLLLGLSFAQTIPRACSTPDTSKYPFCNQKLTIDARIKNLISLLQLEEKPPLLTARESPKGAVPRIGLPAYDWGANCIHGVQSRCGTRCPTSFPTPAALGATFNMSLIRDMGSIIGVELRSLWLQGVGENNNNNLPKIGLDCWSPNININRDPRWGRNMEVPGEDPYMTSQFGIAYTKGLQEGKDPRYLQGIVTLKHWAAYSVENYKGVNRFEYDAKVTSYDLANTYFVAWKAAIVEGNAKGVMCAYNAVNGVPSCASQFLNETLRGTFGFSGYVTSDSGAVACIVNNHHYVKTSEEAAKVAITAGTDINSGSVYRDHLIPALQQGLITEANIDNALYNAFKVEFELGLFDPIDDQPYWHVPPTAVDTPESQALNLLSTRESMILLKNDNTLPFKKGKKVAVIGPHGNAQGAMVGNYIGQICMTGGFSCITSPFAAIQKANTGGSTVYAEGCTVSGNSTAGFTAAIDAAKAADYVVMVLGIDLSVEREGYDRVNINLSGVQDQFAKEIFALHKPTVMILINGGIVAIDDLKGPAPAIIETFYPGFWGGVAMADVVFGDYNPGGKLPVTYYKANIINELDFLSMSMTDAPGRTYRYYTGTPLWPFGYGLSYTTFSIVWSNNTPSHSLLINKYEDQFIVYTANITNTGKVAGDEVAQAYYKPQNMDVPILKQLFGFKRVHLAPGESVVVKFEVTPATFKMADKDGNLCSFPGLYEIEITNGVDQIVSSTVEIVGETKILEKSYVQY